MILAPDGITLARQKIQPMTLPQARWFMDGKTFLQRAGDLYVLYLKVACQGCMARSLPDTVTVIDKPETQQWKIRCAHRGELVLPYDGTPTDTDELLAKIGWTLKCTECPKHNMLDGVEGGNDISSDMLMITCGCTKRMYAMPTAGKRAS